MGPELEVDEHGRIWRVAIRQGRGRSGPGTRLVVVTRRRAENRTSAGYLQVRAVVDGRRVHASAHRLVWIVKRGPIPDGLTVNHIDGVKDNNEPQNLSLATYSEQMVHAHSLGLLHQAGERNPHARLTEREVRIIRERRGRGEPLLAIAADFGVSDRTVSKIARGQRWKDLRVQEYPE